MEFVKKYLWVIVLVIIGFWAMNMYNGFINQEEEVNKAWANVETQYQRRADLIPNLVATVKGYAEHERETFTQVTEARAKVGSVNIDASSLTPENMAQFQQAQSGLSSALSRLLVVAERYPDLKANQNFRDLQAQLEGTENRIAVARTRFNEVAAEFNKRIRRFPANIFNMIYGFETKGVFEADKGAENAPKVEF